MKSCCFTGHRPVRLGGYDWYTPKNIAIGRAIQKQVIDLIENHNVEEFIFGGALGVDQIAFAVCLKLKTEKYPNIKLVLAIPFKNQYIKWNAKDVGTWRGQVALADEVVYVDELKGTRYFNSFNGLGNYHFEKMQTRNEYMVDRAKATEGYVVAVWDGSDGGTGNCVKYANEKGISIVRINPIDVFQSLGQKG